MKLLSSQEQPANAFKSILEEVIFIPTSPINWDKDFWKIYLFFMDFT